MPVYLLDDSMWFPPVTEAMDDGLLAVGGDLSAERLSLAYKSGIFPWYNDDEIIMWWSPDPRFVLFPDELRVSKSMQQILKKNEFGFTVNAAFSEVIKSCSHIERRGAQGTWIGNDMIDAYTRLHSLGYAYSAEAWQDGELVGGLYGVLQGRVFFGESMFSRTSNASKYAFICWVQLLKEKGIQMIDCQVHTPHLESLGARMIARDRFIQFLS